MKNYVCIIGAQRSGTTYLYHLLDEHPEVNMAKPVKPEPKFFLNRVEYDKGKQYYLDKYFYPCDHSISLIGEKGTSYIEKPEVAQRIKSFFPHAKILVTLRNPVSRAISNYCFSSENGLETRSLQDVFMKGIDPPSFSGATSVSPFDYLSRGNYMNYLKPYLSIFQPNLKVVILEEFAGQVNAVQDIYDFLLVDRLFVPPSILNPINESTYKALDSHDLRVVQGRLKDYFTPQIKQLESFLGRRINSWHDTV